MSWAGADPGFFLGGGALVSCSTSTPINQIVFFFAEYQFIANEQPRENASLRDSSLIQPRAIVPGEEIISNRCYI